MKRSIAFVVVLCFVAASATFASARVGVPWPLVGAAEGRITAPSEPGGACPVLTTVFTMRPTTSGWEFVVTDELVRPLGISPICYRLGPVILYGTGSPSTGFTGQVRSGPFTPTSNYGSFEVDSLTFDKPGFIFVTGPATGQFF